MMDYLVVKRTNWKIHFSFFILLSALINACSFEDTDIEVIYQYPFYESIDTTIRLCERVLGPDQLFHDVPINEGIQNVIKRADLFAQIKWEPLSPVPFYPEGYYNLKEYTGVPYSFASEMDCVVGFSVSLDSFYSATKNPYSYFYTQDIRNEPYNCILPGPYFGTVCSCYVAYCLGMEIPYVTYLLDECPYVSKILDQSPEGLCPGDIIWQKGHVLLVYDIARDKTGNIKQITLAESNTPTVRKTCYSYDQFTKIWKDRGWIAYCYTRIGQTKYEDCPNDPHTSNQTSIEWDKPICTAKGDKVPFRKGSIIEINSLNSSSCKFVLYRDGEIFGDYSTYNHKCCLENLPYGHYDVYIDGLVSPEEGASFSIIDYSASICKNGDKVKITFSSCNGEPVYICQCREDHYFLAYYPLSKWDIERGYILFSPRSSESNIYRVFFKGEYGRISSRQLFLITKN